MPPIESHLDDNIDISPPSSQSQDDNQRKELLWENREEILLEEWMENMEAQSKKHRVKGDKFKQLYKLFGIPAILIPIALSSLSNQLEGSPLINSMLMLLAGICSGISNFLNFGRLYSEHYNYEQLYNEMANELKKELSKPKRHRIACDVFMERVYMRYSALNSGAPNV